MKQLTFIGTDDWDQPVYKNENGKLWKDINIGKGKPYLHSSSDNEFDGEPDTPLIGNYEIIKAPELVDEGMKFNYMMLGKLKGDCEYFLGHGNMSLNILTPKAHIEEMKKLWNGFPENGKPEWLTWEQILKYEKDMNCK